MAAVNTGVTVERGFDCDVLVVGAGLAGTMAALSAARSGERVALAAEGPRFSGASFFASTWGLGVVGPRDENDVDGFCAAIESVGRGVADPELVRVLAEGIVAAEEELERLGVELMVPEHPEEKTYIPCFDTELRRWRGLGRDSYRSAVGKALAKAGVEVLEKHSLLDLVRSEGACAPLLDAAPGEGAVAGALLAGSEGPVFVRAASVVLATGGIAGIFERSLMGPFVSGQAHGIALSHGCALANIEFLQFMPTIVDPVSGIVFNEKTFRYAELAGRPDLDGLLELRSGYGPFTSERPSREVDIAIAEAGQEGLGLSYTRLPEELPEFVATYFDWFEHATGLTSDAPLRIAHYAHAANGGIAIDSGCACGIGGLFAAGEAAGGVHGADRIGGLASAAALVFGLRAGASAAEHARNASAPARKDVRLVLLACPKAAELEGALKHRMSLSCGVMRSHDGIAEARSSIAETREKLASAKASDDLGEARATIALAQKLRLADAFAAACDARTESLGSHYRSDAAN